MLTEVSDPARAHRTDQTLRDTKCASEQIRLEKQDARGWVARVETADRGSAPRSSHKLQCGASPVGDTCGHDVDAG